MRTRVAAVVIALAGSLAGCGGAEVVAQDAAPPDIALEVTAAPTPALGVEVTSGSASVPPPLSADTLRRMRRNSVFEIKVVDPADERPKVSAERMTEIVTKRRKGGAPAEMSLVR